MTDPETTAILKSIEAKMSALLAITVHQALVDDPDLPNPRPRSIDKLLLNAGLTHTQIASQLGKSVSAVSQMIAKG